MAIAEHETIFRLRRNRLRWKGGLSRIPWVALILLSPMIVWGISGSAIYPHDPMAIDLMAPNKPPAWLAGGAVNHFLGTDNFGRDILSRLMEGARIALIVGTLAVVFSALIGVTLGAIAGYFGGWIDNLIMRLVDIKMSMPSLLLTILIGAAIGGGVITVLIAITALFWADYARVIRGETVTLRERDFVMLAKVANCSTFRIISRHIFPLLTATTVVLMSIQLGRALIVEASITFLGYGIQPPAAAWGLMIADGRTFIATNWWIPAFPGLLITITVLGANFLGDWLRDFLDPRLR